MEIVKVCDANIFVNNESQHGIATEVTCPELSAIMGEHKALGMIGSAEFFNGFEKMEATIKWTYPSNDILKVLSNPTKPVDLMIRSNKAVYKDGELTEEVAIVMYIRGLSKKHPGGSFKPKEDTELETTISVQYYKQEIDGESIVEIDIMKNIYKIGEDDITATRRQNLGI